MNAMPRKLQTRPEPRLVLRLYVAGRLANSARAVGNLKQICAEHVTGPYDLEVIDVLAEPQRALADEVLVTPMLVRVAPAPRVQVIGDLSDTAVVLAALGIHQVNRS
jgi:circadian clock protein KaiB